LFKGITIKQELKLNKTIAAQVVVTEWHDFILAVKYILTYG